MASFIHLADAKKRRLIEKNGIKAAKRGIFCVPVISNFSVTHQWSRELKRTGVKELICIQFRVPDDEAVTLGRYNGEKISMSAAESVATVMAHTNEIARIYPAPRVVGWRYSPEAKGKQPFCHCRYCNRGEIRASRLIRDD